VVNEDVAAGKAVELLNLACRRPESVCGIINPVGGNS
jgi:hypothetical protein